MKYLKLFGLAAVMAAALMAFVGAGTASAVTQDVLCKKTETPHCSASNVYPAGTLIEAETIEGAEGAKNATLTSSLGDTHCDGKVKGTTETQTTPRGKPTVTWSNCEGAETVSTITDGSTKNPTAGTSPTIELHHDAEHNGTVTIKDIVVHVKRSGVSCFYGGEVTGTLTASANDVSNAVIHITQKVTKIDNIHHDSSFFCPSEPTWHATYKVTKPTPLYVGTENVV